MPGFIVETYRPAYPERGVRVRVHRQDDWPDCASPSMTTAWHVDYCKRSEAIALALEAAAGLRVVGQRLHPKSV
jgi:hypothetical protein